MKIARCPISKISLFKVSEEGVETQIMKSIEFSNSGYIIAWEAICQRFDNKKIAGPQPY